ncbi:hypothetical protein K4K57_007088 [Colletotrichum sp. SAR 10_99]|nr:hypothetical protein K4K57_007088 [Colletotrichum sp. SAR 10_99]
MPSTPSHSRHASSVDASYQYSANSSPQRRRQSRSSTHESTTPLRGSFNQQDALDVSYASGGAAAGNGLGNLADELADAFSDSGDEGEYYEDETGAPNISVEEADGKPGAEGTRDSGVDVASLGEAGSKARNLNLGPPSPPRRGHRRSGSEYDGSEYGSESDLDSPGMLPSLVAKIDAVESLARRGTESNGGPTDGVFSRVTESLRDLGSQAGVEGSATRQTTTTATRRLKSAKELVAEIRREEELCEEGERWLTRGNWSERLRKRECAGVCGDVVSGFEEVCDGWRARLLEQAGSAPA